MAKRDEQAGKSKKGLWRLMLKLPALRGRLQILAASSSVLDDLCEAYEIASSAFEALSKRNEPGDAARAAEYEGLCSEIEGDVIHLVLQRAKNGQE